MFPSKNKIISELDKEKVEGGEVDKAKSTGIKSRLRGGQHDVSSFSTTITDPAPPVAGPSSYSAVCFSAPKRKQPEDATNPAKKSTATASPEIVSASSAALLNENRETYNPIASTSTMIPAPQPLLLVDDVSRADSFPRLRESDIGYPGNRNCNDRLKVNTGPGLPIRSEEVPELQFSVAQEHFNLMYQGYVKYKIGSYESVNDIFYKDFWKKTDGKKVDAHRLHLKLDEIFKMSDGLFYVRHHSHEESMERLASLKTMKFGELSYFYKKLFASDGPKSSTRNFFNVLDRLPIDKHRKGTGLLLPKIEEDINVSISCDEERINLNLDNLQNPLKKVYRDKLNNIKKTAGVTVAKTYFGFSGSVSPSRVADGPALDEVNVVVAGGSRTWLIVSSIFFELVRELLLEELNELGLDDDDHLMKDTQYCILQHGCLLMSPSFYKKHKIDCEIVTQNDGEILVLGSKTINSSVCNGDIVSKSVCAVLSDFHVKFNHGSLQCELDTNAGQLDDTSDDEDDKPKRCFLKKSQIDQLLTLSEDLLPLDRIDTQDGDEYV